MQTDPPKGDALDTMLEEIAKTLQENQRFLASLKQDQSVEDELAAGPDDGTVDDAFEEL